MSKVRLDIIIACFPLNLTEKLNIVGNTLAFFVKVDDKKKKKEIKLQLTSDLA